MKKLTKEIYMRVKMCLNQEISLSHGQLKKIFMSKDSKCQENNIIDLLT